MCGIGGILFFKENKRVLQEKIEILNNTQLHRGPDEQTILILTPHAFCHQRLTLVDAKGGQQPFKDNSGRYLLVYNGELYNYKELRAILSSEYSFRTNSDTEVILAAYLVWGESCLNHFNGMFAFFIWDTIAERGFAARDPLGVKPFVYFYQNGTFYFSSEVKSLLKILDNTTQIDPYQLAEYIIAPSLSGGGDLSIFKGIKYLEPGSYIFITPSDMKTKRYYSFNWNPVELEESLLIDLMGKEVEKSVEISLTAGTPTGIFLSGGLDSSLIAAIAVKHSKNPLKAYTIIFDDHESIHFDPSTIVNSDDLPYTRELAHLLKIPLNYSKIYHQDISTTLRSLSEINDRIPAWEQEITQHALSQSASTSLKAVLVGDASDEINYGYFFLLNPLINYSPSKLIEFIGGNKRMELLTPEFKKRIDPLGYLDNKYRKIAKNAGYDFDKNADESILAMSTLIHNNWLSRLLHNGDIYSMRFGLEARVPFANLNFLQIASKIHPKIGFKKGVEKYLLRKVASKWLPDKFFNRKKSALPRDPRLGCYYKKILKSLLVEKNDFIDTFLDRKALSKLCTPGPVSETDRVLLFHMICLIHWSRFHVK